MATSSAEDVPRSLQFLFSRNRLNVAVSRAMCLTVVVASPRLLESRARTIDQMRLITRSADLWIWPTRRPGEHSKAGVSYFTSAAAKS